MYVYTHSVQYMYVHVYTVFMCIHYTKVYMYTLVHVYTLYMHVHVHVHIECALAPCVKALLHVWDTFLHGNQLACTHSRDLGEEATHTLS